MRHQKQHEQPGRHRLASLLGGLCAFIGLAQAHAQQAPAQAQTQMQVQMQAQVQAQTPRGTSTGSAWVHTPQSLEAAVGNGRVVVPAGVVSEKVFSGPFKELPARAGVSTNPPKVPVVLFMHGSSGLANKPIVDWQNWLAGLGIASLAPDSFALPERVTYQSPVERDIYERIHAMRLSEIGPALDALKKLPWVDAGRLTLAGTSEGGVPVARYAGHEFAARIIYSWSCEANYFVKAPENHFDAGKPVLNVISASDPYFSAANPWLDNPRAKGHCGAALKDYPDASVVLIPEAPHTVLMINAGKDATLGFLKRIGMLP